ncbi:hypothetical protein GALL_341340 [mine drainage metagenome]|uniref:Uncharacterized protein n=1 Tax=mine drainage metagenome TaxID=410659 RepID=A0A1J5QKM4_9ZZZZ
MTTTTTDPVRLTLARLEAVLDRILTQLDTTTGERP